MRLRDSVIGALNVFTQTERHLDSSELAVVRALADVATISLLQERAIRRGAVLAEQLQLALTSRVIIEQAKGAIAQAQGTTTDEAFEILRTHARRHHLKTTDLARTCVNEPTQVPELMAGTKPPRLSESLRETRAQTDPGQRRYPECCLPLD